MSTYIQTFTTMLDVLAFTTFSTKPVSWVDIQENVIDRDRHTIARYLRDLECEGYLNRERKKMYNSVNYYSPTKKAKQLFGALV